MTEASLAAELKLPEPPESETVTIAKDGTKKKKRKPIKLEADLDYYE